ncbi:MAG: hypothetical protein Rubg2KO_33570 [Rubricoccaceae bacterium]
MRRSLTFPFVGLVLALAGAYGLAACQSAGPEGATVAADEDWTYVGSEACSSCHADLTTSYLKTGMGRAVSLFDPETAVERFQNGRSPLVCSDDGYCYQAVVRGDSLIQLETRPDGPGYMREHAVSHVIGSGHATRSYLMEAGGAGEGSYLTMMPLTWYVERAVWDLSPGYAQTNQRFDRAINLDCLTCHNGRPEHEPSLNFYTDVPLGITCERCHGPGSAHVDAYLADDDPADSKIVNPANLALDLQLDVCQQCHLTGETIYAPGEDATTYRPGRPLSAHRAVFVRQASLDDPESFGISSHAERMMRSACFEETQGTDGALTCTTCHDPHIPVAELPREHFSNTCQSCHDGNAHLEVCSRPEATTMAEAVTGDCVSCHMRTAGTSDIPHVSFTDHWIQKTPPPPAPGDFSDEAFRRETPFTLVNLVTPAGDASSTSAAEADIELGMATYMLYETMHRLPAYLPEVAARIRRGLAEGADRTDARVTLGQALLAMDSTVAAEQVLADAVERDPENGLAAMWLGRARIEIGRAEAAIGPLQEAVRLAPRRTGARLALAEAQAEAGQLQEAIATLEAAMAQDPVAYPSGWNDLGFYTLQLGDVDAALAPLRRSVALDPQLELARVNLGAALLASDDLPAAAAQLTAALRIDPNNQGALGNLGVVRGRQGQTAEARALFQRLLTLNPGDARAAAALAELDS